MALAEPRVMRRDKIRGSGDETDSSTYFSRSKFRGEGKTHTEMKPFRSHTFKKISVVIRMTLKGMQNSEN